MNSQKRDESRDRRREEALARRMGDALDQLEHRSAGECPDAELIAAHHEKSLQQDEIAQWEGHFATCTRCRKILLVLAASVGTPLDEREVARLGQMVAAVRSPLEPNSRTFESVWLGWGGRWLAPALGVAAVLAVWFAIRPPWRTAEQAPSGTLIAQAPKNETPPGTEARAMDRSADVAPMKGAESDAEAQKDRPATRAQSPNSPTDALAKNRLDGGQVNGGLAPGSGDTGSELRDEKKEQTELKEAAPAAPASAPLPPPPSPRELQTPRAFPQAQAKVNPKEPSVREAPSSNAQSGVVNEEAPALSAAAGAVGDVPANGPARAKQAGPQPGAASDKVATQSAANLRRNGRDFDEFSALKVPGLDGALLKSPSGKILWRLGKGGSVERSIDTGRTWNSQTSPLLEDWQAGAAVSDTICWVVGRKGAIARTTDGEHWEKISPPPMAVDSSGKSPDWVGIAAVGAQTATITAGDQRRYATQDGGKTWKAQ